jgi:hypothetical protein
MGMSDALKVMLMHLQIVRYRHILYSAPTVKKVPLMDLDIRCFPNAILKSAVTLLPYLVILHIWLSTLTYVSLQNLFKLDDQKHVI